MTIIDEFVKTVSELFTLSDEEILRDKYNGDFDEASREAKEFIEQLEGISTREGSDEGVVIAELSYRVTDFYIFAIRASIEASKRKQEENRSNRKAQYAETEKRFVAMRAESETKMETYNAEHAKAKFDTEYSKTKAEIAKASEEMDAKLAAFEAEYARVSAELEANRAKVESISDFFDDFDF